MEKTMQEKRNYSIKVLSIVVIILLITTAIIIVLINISNYMHTPKENTLSKPNYLACYQSGLCKIDAQPRQPTPYDIDTGVRINYQGQKYAIVLSRTIATGDIGKSFVVRVE